MDFTQTKELRQAIHAREHGRCFYCLRKTRARMLCIDHVVPRAEFGCNSYRNLVSCCQECNPRKGDSPAADFLRLLFRDGQLKTEELKGQLSKLGTLAAGKLQPVLTARGRPNCAPKINTVKTEVHAEAVALNENLGGQ